MSTIAKERAPLRYKMQYIGNHSKKHETQVINVSDNCHFENMRLVNSLFLERCPGRSVCKLWKFLRKFCRLRAPGQVCLVGCAPRAKPDPRPGQVCL